MAKTKEGERLFAIRISETLHRHFKTYAAMRGVAVKDLGAMALQKCVDEMPRAGKENE